MVILGVRECTEHLSGANHQEAPCLLFLKCTSIKDAPGLSETKGTRIGDKLLLLLWCHCTASKAPSQAVLSQHRDGTQR